MGIEPSIDTEFLATCSKNFCAVIATFTPKSLSSLVSLQRNESLLEENRRNASDVWSFLTRFWLVESYGVTLLIYTLFNRILRFTTINHIHTLLDCSNQYSCVQCRFFGLFLSWIIMCKFSLHDDHILIFLKGHCIHVFKVPYMPSVGLSSSNDHLQ